MNARTFTRKHRIRFSECDPAGIVFYPQYFVMFNNLLESWIDELLPEVGFAGYIGKLHFGLPTVRLEADFRAISRMGDDVVLSLAGVELGRKSLTLALACTDVAGEVRMSITQVLVSTSLIDHQAIEIPSVLRQVLGTSPSLDKDNNERSAM